MEWLKAFDQANELNGDNEISLLVKKRNSECGNLTLLQRLELEGKIFYLCNLKKSGVGTIVHSVPVRFTQIVKIPELVDPDNNWFI